MIIAHWDWLCQYWRLADGRGLSYDSDEHALCGAITAIMTAGLMQHRQS